jgi:hypothetical protein
MGGLQERPTTCDLRADGETVLPLCGSGDDVSDLEDPVNSREAAEVTVRWAPVSSASRETLKGIPDRTFDATHRQNAQEVLRSLFDVTNPMRVGNPATAGTCADDSSSAGGCDVRVVSAGIRGGSRDFGLPGPFESTTGERARD